MPTTVLYLITGLAIAAIALAASGGHLIFLPLFFVVPLGLFALGPRRRR